MLANIDTLKPSCYEIALSKSGLETLGNYPHIQLWIWGWWNGAESTMHTVLVNVSNLVTKVTATLLCGGSIC